MEQATPRREAYSGPDGPSGPSPGGFAGSLTHLGNQATQRLQASAKDAADEQAAMQRAQQNHLAELVATHEKIGEVIDKVAPPAWSSYPLNSPAITVNVVVGLVFALLTLFGVSLTPEKSDALTYAISALFLIGPVVGGFVIKAINSRKAV